MSETSDQTPPADEPVDTRMPSLEPEHWSEIRYQDLTERERAIYELGFHTGYTLAEPGLRDELDKARQEAAQADRDADRYYAAAFDHDNHDCGIHENKGPYKGAARRLIHSVPDWEELYYADDPSVGPSDQGEA